MSLNTQVIGKAMPHGFAGSYARQPDSIINTRPVGGKVNIPFGTALMYDSGKAVVTMGGAGVDAAKFAGVAGSEIKSALSYTDQSTGVYAPGDACSVFQRGSINVLCQRGAPALGGDVYVRIEATTEYPTALVGGGWVDYVSAMSVAYGMANGSGSLTPARSTPSDRLVVDSRRSATGSYYASSDKQELLGSIHGQLVIVRRIESHAKPCPVCVADTDGTILGWMAEADLREVSR